MFAGAVASASDYINMESMVAAAGLMAAAGVDCSDPSIAASQRVFDLLNQGYHNDKLLTERLPNATNIANSLSRVANEAGIAIIVSN